MRSNTWAFLAAAGMIAVAAIGACTGDVSTTETSGTSSASGAGGGAGGGMTTSNGTTTTTTTTTTTASGTGPGGTTTTTTGGGTPCDAACAHLVECVGLGCDQLPVQFDCGSPEQECAANCVKDADCGDIIKVAMQDLNTPLGQCLGGCGLFGGTGGGGQGGAGGGGNQSCFQCAQGPCGGTLQACFGNSDCQKWLQCAGGCFQGGQGQQCFTDCDNQFPGAAAQYQPIYDCACTNCGNECASDISCGGGAGGSGQGGAGGAGK